MENENRRQTQEQKVKAWLTEVGPLTPIDALRLFGSFRLAAIIHRLRNQGWNIQTDYITKDGATFAEYTLINNQLHI